MAALLDATDSQMATLAALVESLAAAEKTLASMQAARDGLLALALRLATEIAQQAGHPDHGDMSTRTVAAEIGAAQRVSDRTIERRMAEAAGLVEHFPKVWMAQGAGRISASHSRVIVDAGAHLDDQRKRDAYAADVLPIAENESPNRLRRLARRVAERHQARTVTERHGDARERRRVWVNDLDDGMSELGMLGPATLVHGMYDRLSQMAHAVREENARAAKDLGSDARVASATADAVPLVDDHHALSDNRTVDQLRADLLADLVLTAAPTGHDTEDQLLGAITARIEVNVPVMTLMGDDLDTNSRARIIFDRAPLAPAELDGSMPIDIETARALASTAPGWDRVLTHPISGALLAVDRYRPSEQLRRHLKARDQRCRFMGCGLAARKCDVDHNDAASTGGATCDSNLAHFCRRHHMLKHHSPWHVTQLSGGMLEWRSPAGRVYVDRPPTQNTVRFKPAGTDPSAGIPPWGSPASSGGPASTGTFASSGTSESWGTPASSRTSGHVSKAATSRTSDPIVPSDTVRSDAPLASWPAADAATDMWAAAPPHDALIPF